MLLSSCLALALSMDSMPHASSGSVRRCRPAGPTGSMHRTLQPVTVLLALSSSVMFAGGAAISRGLAPGMAVWWQLQMMTTTRR